MIGQEKPEGSGAASPAVLRASSLMGRRVSGTLSIVFLLLHVHCLPSRSASGAADLSRSAGESLLTASSVQKTISAALQRHFGLVGVALAPFRVLQVDSQTQTAVVRTTAAAAPSVILAAASAEGLAGEAGEASVAEGALNCRFVLMRSAASLSALAAPRSPQAVTLKRRQPV